MNQPQKYPARSPFDLILDEEVENSSPKPRTSNNLRRSKTPVVRKYSFLEIIECRND